jgi:hypothetical protein
LVIEFGATGLTILELVVELNGLDVEDKWSARNLARRSEEAMKM